jgi:hypothetical protein
MSQFCPACQGSLGPQSTPPAPAPQTDFQRLVLEQALALAQHLEQAAESAPDGHVLDRCEAAILSSGRDFLRQVLTASLQQRISQVEKKGARAAPVLADRPAGTRGPTRATS